jgi:hypothetical protein
MVERNAASRFVFGLAVAKHTWNAAARRWNETAPCAKWAAVEDFQKSSCTIRRAPLNSASLFPALWRYNAKRGSGDGLQCSKLAPHDVSPVPGKKEK